MENRDQVIANLLAEEDAAKQSKDSDGKEGSKGEESKDQGKLYSFNGKQLTADQLADEATKLNKDYTQKSQRLAEIEAKGTAGTTPDADPTNTEHIRKQLEAVVGGKILTENDWQQRETQLMNKLAIDSQIKDLEKTIDGTDGRPAFKRQEVLDWIQNNQYRVTNVEDAYKLMHEEQIAKWRIEQYNKAKGESKMPGQRGQSTSSPSLPREPNNKEKATPGSRKYFDQMGDDIDAMLTK